jgi:hypothetical protein
MGNFPTWKHENKSSLMSNVFFPTHRFKNDVCNETLYHFSTRNNRVIILVHTPVAFRWLRREGSLLSWKNRRLFGVMGQPNVSGTPRTRPTAVSGTYPNRRHDTNHAST